MNDTVAPIKHLTAWLRSLPGKTDDKGRLSRTMVAEWCGISFSLVGQIVCGARNMSEEVQHRLSRLLADINDGRIKPVCDGEHWTLRRVRLEVDHTCSTRSPLRATISLDGPGGPKVQWGKP
jgi:hypothetical protein